MSGEALEVIDAHGELLDVRHASTERLARAITDLNETRDRLRGLEIVVGDELVERIDKLGQWTVRVDDDEYRYELKVPSPAAGTESYPERELDEALRALVDADVIAPEGADRALKRTLAVEFAVPWEANPDEMASVLEDAVSIQIAGEQVSVASVEARRKPVKSGITALLKIPGTREKLEEAKRVSDPPARRVKVTAHKRMRVE